MRLLERFWQCANWPSLTSNASQYQAVAKVSKATATRHLTDLLEKGCLLRLPGGGRSTRYGLAPA
jgi:Fic family protein